MAEHIAVAEVSMAGAREVGMIGHTAATASGGAPLIR
jgi:hypothetical protein